MNLCTSSARGVGAVLPFLLFLSGCSEYRLRGERPEEPPEGDEPVDSGTPWVTRPVEEWCNGVDDDGDGLVDEGFSDIDGDGTADCVDEACAVELPSPRTETCGICQGDERPLSPPPVDPWNWTVEWAWHDGVHRLSEGTVLSTPVVGDLDADGQPEVVFVYYDDLSSAPQSLIVLDGATGSTRWVLDGFNPARTVALGDINGDGFGDIVAYALPDEGSSFLRAVDRDGLALWDLEHEIFSHTGDLANPYITDLEGDGAVEVLAHNLIIDGSTGTVLAELEGAEIGHTATWSPVSADLDGDGQQEILCNNGVYDNQGMHLFDCGDAIGFSSFSQAADIDGDALGEVVSISDGLITVCDDDGTVLWVQDHGYRTGPSSIADFDGDGLQEIAVVLDSSLMLFDGDGAVLWETPVSELSGCPGPTAWDMDLDGTPELILADWEDLLVLDGNTGTVVMSIADHASNTKTETPTVADIDGDGHGEILFGSGPCLHNPCNWLGVHAIGSTDGDWPWAPPVYNQHGYHRGGINDDLSVPTDTTPHWLRDDNVFRGQAPPLVTPDLPNLQAEIHDVCIASCADDGVAMVSLQIWNSGAAEADAGVSLRLYAVVDDLEQLIHEHTTTAAIPAAASLEWTVETERHLLGSELRLVVDEDNAVEECIEDDNQGVLTVEFCEQR